MEPILDRKLFVYREKRSRVSHFVVGLSTLVILPAVFAFALTLTANYTQQNPINSLATVATALQSESANTLSDFARVIGNWFVERIPAVTLSFTRNNQAPPEIGSTAAPAGPTVAVVATSTLASPRPPLSLIAPGGNSSATAGVDENTLNTKLSILKNDLLSRISQLSAAGRSNVLYVNPSADTFVTRDFFSKQVDAIYNSMALVSRIDQLSGVTITNPTITGGSVTATAFSGTLAVSQGGTGVTTAPSYGQLLVGNGDGGYTLTATSSLGLGGSGANTGVANTWSALQLFSAGASSTQFSVLGPLYVGTTGTTTISGTATSTFAAGIQTTYLNITGTAATSTAANGFNLSAGCFAVNGTCITGGGGGASLSAQNTWTALQLFGAGASSTNLSNFGAAYFGGTATSTFDSAGNLSVAGTLGVTGKTTLGYASTTGITASYASTSNLIASNSFTISNVTGFLKAVAGAVSTALINLASDVTGILSVGNGGTGWSSIAASAIPYGNGSGALATTTSGTAGYVLAYLNGVPTWTATSTLADITGTLAASKGGTGISNPSAAGVFVGGYSGGSWQQIATSSLGLLTTNVAEGSNLYYSDARVGSYISGSSTVPHIGGAAYGDVLSWTGNVWATRATSTLTLNTDNLVEGSSNLFWTNTRFDNRLSATTSLPNLTTLANLATVGTITSGTWNGSIFGVPYGGTGWAAIQSGAIPYGNGSGALATTSAGTAGNVLTLSGGIPTWVATTTFSGALAYSGGNVTCNTANGSIFGCLAAADWTTFNNKVSTSRAISTTYPLQGGGDLSADRTLTLAFGTTTANSWSSLQQFGNASTSLFSSYGPVYFGASATSSFSSTGVLTLASALGVGSGGTGATTFGQGWLFSTGGTGALAASTSPTVNYLVATSTTATSTFSTGGFTIGGSQFVVQQTSGNVGIGTTSPASLFSVAGSGYLTGNLGLGTNANDAIFTIKSSGGSDVSFKNSNGVTKAYMGVASIDGSAATDQLRIRGDAGILFSISGSPAAVINTSGNVGIGTTTPGRKLSVLGDLQVGSSATAAGILLQTNGTAGEILGINHANNTNNDITFSGAISNILYLKSSNGNVGIGTTSPSNNLHINKTNGTGGLTVQSNTQSAITFAKANGTGGMYIGRSLSSDDANNFFVYDIVNSATRMLIDSSGNVGIGTTTPNSRFVVQTGTAEIVAATIAGTEVQDWPTAALSIRRFDDFTTMRMLQLGHVNDNPYQTGSSVWNFSLVDNTGSKATSDSNTDLSINGPGVLMITGSGGTCTFTGGVTGGSCFSDQRVKDNIESLSGVSALEGIEKLRPVSYTLRLDPSLGPQLGFLAQDVQQIFPELVSTSTVTTAWTPDGTLQLAESGIISPLVAAVQELNLRLDTIASTSASSAPDSQSFAASFFSNLFARITSRLADAANGIQEIIARTFRAKEQLCINDTCVNEDQLKALLAAPAAASPSESGTPPDTEPAVVTDPAEGASTPIEAANNNDPAASSTPSSVDHTPPEAANDNVPIPTEATGTDPTDLTSSQ